MGLFTVRANRIVPSAPHAPCAMSGTSTIVSGVPPDRLIFFSFPPAQKPMNCESGDQKGSSAPSVCSSFRASEELSGRIHKELSPDASVAAKANISPSGESAMYSNGCQFLCNVMPCGRPRVSCTAFGRDEPECRNT